MKQTPCHLFLAGCTSRLVFHQGLHQGAVPAVCDPNHHFHPHAGHQPACTASSGCSYRCRVSQCGNMCCGESALVVCVCVCAVKGGCFLSPPLLLTMRLTSRCVPPHTHQQALGDFYIFKKSFNDRAKLALGTIVVGSCVYAATDINYDFWGYVWVLTNTALVVANQLYVMGSLLTISKQLGRWTNSSRVHPLQWQV